MSTLRIGGEASGKALELTRDDLERIEARHQVPDVGNLVAGREGRAVHLRALADLAGASDAARFVHVESRDGTFTANVEIETALTSGLVLHSLADDDLPARYGGPFRLLFADSDDCSVNVKDLARIEFLETEGSHTARCDD